jgi:hypothetical protein
LWLASASRAFSLQFSCLASASLICFTLFDHGYRKHLLSTASAIVKGCWGLLLEVICSQLSPITFSSCLT